MKKILCSVVLLVAVIVPCSSFADTMIVKVPVLNVRSCPSTDCSIVKKLKKGDKVKVNDMSGAWVQIESQDKTGYTIKRSLRNSYSYLWYYIIGGILLLAFLSHLYDSFENRCPQCKKWGAMKEIDRECIEEKASNIKKVATTKYKTHTRRREYIVPATVYTYRLTKKCTHCGEIRKSLISEKREN